MEMSHTFYQQQHYLNSDKIIHQPTLNRMSWNNRRAFISSPWRSLPPSAMSNFLQLSPQSGSVQVERRQPPLLLLDMQNQQLPSSKPSWIQQTNNRHMTPFGDNQQYYCESMLVNNVKSQIPNLFGKQLRIVQEIIDPYNGGNDHNNNNLMVIPTTQEDWSSPLPEDLTSQETAKLLLNQHFVSSSNSKKDNFGDLLNPFPLTNITQKHLDLQRGLQHHDDDTLNPRKQNEQPTQTMPYQQQQQKTAGITGGSWNHWCSSSMKQEATQTDVEISEKQQKQKSAQQDAVQDQETVLSTFVIPTPSQFNLLIPNKKEQLRSNPIMFAAQPQSGEHRMKPINYDNNNNTTSYQAPIIRNQTHPSMTFQKPQSCTRMSPSLVNSRQSLMTLMPEPDDQSGLQDEKQKQYCNSKKNHLRKMKEQKQDPCPGTEAKQRGILESVGVDVDEMSSSLTNSSVKKSHDPIIVNKRVSFSSNTENEEKSDRLRGRTKLNFFTNSVKPGKSILKEVGVTISQREQNKKQQSTPPPLWLMPTESQKQQTQSSTPNTVEKIFRQQQAMILQEKLAAVRLKLHALEIQSRRILSHPKKSLRHNRTKNAQVLDQHQQPIQKRTLSPLSSSHKSSTGSRNAYRNTGSHDRRQNSSSVMQVYDCSRGLLRSRRKTAGYNREKISEFNIKVQNLRKHDRLPMLSPISAIKINCQDKPSMSLHNLNMPTVINGFHIDRLLGVKLSARKRQLKKKVNPAFDSTPIINPDKFRRFQDGLKKRSEKSLVTRNRVQSHPPVKHFH